MANLKHGFIDYKGNQWPNTWVDNYNRYNEEVEKRERMMPSIGSLAHKELEVYRNQRHQLFTMLVDKATGDNVRKEYKYQAQYRNVFGSWENGGTYRTKEEAGRIAARNGKLYDFYRVKKIQSK